MYTGEQRVRKRVVRYFLLLARYPEELAAVWICYFGITMLVLVGTNGGISR